MYSCRPPRAHRISGQQPLAAAQQRSAAHRARTSRLRRTLRLNARPAATSSTNNMSLARVSVLGCLMLSAAAVPREGMMQPGANISVLQLATKIPELSTFVRALKAANLTDVLSKPGAFTIFAPNNEAFAALPPGRLEGLLDPNNIEELQAVLEYHVVLPGSELIYSKDLEQGESIPMLQGESVDVKLPPPSGAIFIDRSRMVKVDLAASNGVIHTIGSVLEPLGLNHLYFRFINGDYNCGQVDAGPRMPPAIFNKENEAALQMYIDATLAFAWIPLFPLYNLEPGTCSAKGFTDNDGVPGISPMLNVPCRDIKEPYEHGFLPDNRTIDWAPKKLMQPICLEHCECNYRGGDSRTSCKDVPDDPLAASWCSLCGPKFNRPIEIQCFKTEEH